MFQALDPELRRIEADLANNRKRQDEARRKETELRQRAQEAIKRINFELEREERRMESDMRGLDRDIKQLEERRVRAVADAQKKYEDEQRRSSQR